jgi:type IV pilus assembly protein PilV
MIMTKRSGSAGFSLIEVMVAVLVISVGLLGIAKMQALAISNTGNSRLRALVAMQASGLASAMQADRSYWATVPTVGKDLTATISGSSITAASDSTLTTGQKCEDPAAPPVCTAPQMAAYDLQQWASDLNNLVPNETVSIGCNLPTATSYVTCTITVSWNENLVNSNSAQQTNATVQAALATPTYVLIVQP